MEAVGDDRAEINIDGAAEPPARIAGPQGAVEGEKAGRWGAVGYIAVRAVQAGRVFQGPPPSCTETSPRPLP